MPEGQITPPFALPAAWRADPRVLPLTGAVQHYDWGGDAFLPGLLGRANPEGRPFAELWMGAHPSAPAAADVDGVSVTLDTLVDGAADVLLGPETTARFSGRLPYLFKVLDARNMLSIQAHPTKRQAEEGFARENAGGIALKAPHRNYRDDNHKPEVHVALTDFWMLHGFRPLEEIIETLRAAPEMGAVLPDFRERLRQAGTDAAARRDLLRTLYGTIMTLPQTQVDALLDPLIQRLERASSLDKDTPDFWALRAAEDFPLPGGHRDRGIFSVYLLNLVRLRPGQGTFQPAGTLHAYLEGVNVELMANSDNVLRGGLTPKHVDVSELMQVLAFEEGPPEILSGERVSATETRYRAPVDEFVLSRIQLRKGQRYVRDALRGPDTLLVLEGAVEVQAEKQVLARGRGEMCLVPHGLSYVLVPKTASAALFKASVPAK